MSNLDDPEWVETFAEFAEESREALERAEATLITVEADRLAGRAVDPEAIAELFRTFHTVKGTAGFLALEQTVRVAHAAENLLDRVRAGEREVESRSVTVLCEAVDFLVGAIQHIGAEGEDATLADRAAPVIRTLQRVDEGADEPEASASASASPTASTESGSADPSGSESAGSESAGPESAGPESAGPESSGAGARAGTGVGAGTGAGAGAGAGARTGAGTGAGAAAPSGATSARSEGSAAPTTRAVLRGASEAREVIRVDAARVDALLNMVGELVIAENMTSREVGEALQASRGLLQLQRVTRQLQDLTMSMRMVPIRGVFRKMHRLVRDLTKRQGKLAELVVVGEDTEVDKSLVDAIGDPLVHLLRNAIDHGLESPEEREALGKPARGTLTLTAAHQGGEVHIEIRDDGRGIDRERVLARARDRGLIADGSELSDGEVYQLLFQPGFSTAEAVTDVSGRGVGMDVVKRNVERFNGRVQVTSELGRGTCMTLRVPLTLAIVDGMLLRVRDQSYTVPMLQVRESIPRAETTVVDLPGGGQLVELREQFVPFLRLRELFGLGGEPESQAIVVFLEGVDGLVGVLVDEVVGQQQTVIKPMPALLPPVRAASGCCILGDGRVSLILDGNALSGIGRAAAGGARGGVAA